MRVQGSVDCVQHRGPQLLAQVRWPRRRGTCDRSGLKPLVGSRTELTDKQFPEGAHLAFDNCSGTGLVPDPQKRQASSASGPTKWDVSIARCASNEFALRKEECRRFDSAPAHHQTSSCPQVRSHIAWVTPTRRTADVTPTTTSNCGLPPRVVRGLHTLTRIRRR